MSSRVRTSFRLGILEHVRTPVLLALLFFLPIYFIQVSAMVLPDKNLLMAGADTGIVMVSFPSLIVALITPCAAALIGGIVGLFLMETSKEADQRLVISGFRHVDIVLSRLGLTATAAVVVTGVSVGVALLNFSPRALWLFVAATFLATLLYGMVGILVGSFLGRLPGVYLMLFGPLMDIVLVQNPLATDTAWWGDYFPGYFVTKIAIDASFTAGFNWSNFSWAAAYLAVLVVSASGALYVTSTE